MYKTTILQGRSVLDERGPSDWRFRLDVDRLNLGITTTCVIGQVFACQTGYDYARAAKELGAPSTGHCVCGCSRDASFSEWMKQHGFEVTLHSGYDQLTREWQRQLESDLLLLEQGLVLA